MNINRLCRGCFHVLPEGQRICPCCGFDLNRYEQQRKAEILPTGTILHGSYITGKCLGQGGFGITYIGYHKDLETVVAIKELFPMGVVSRDTRGSGDTFTVSLTGYDMQESYQKTLDSFIREARTLAKLDMAGVVKVTDCFRENGTAYIVMKYIEGQSLKEYQKTLGGPMREDDVLTLLHPVITSLKELHKKEIIHRDISPDNLMLGKDGKVILVDFGAARSLSTSIEKAGRSLTVILKPGYAPMEQYSSKGLQGPWTDVYALCATMFHLMTGTVPNQPVDRSTDPDDEYSLKKLLYTNGVSKHIVNVLIKGMSLQPASRYQSMQELEDALYSKATENPNMVEQTEESDGRTVTEALASNLPLEKEDSATEELLSKKKYVPLENDNVVERHLFELPWVIGSIGLILVISVVLGMVFIKPLPQPDPEVTTNIEESVSQSQKESESQAESEHLVADSVSNEVQYTEFGTNEEDDSDQYTTSAIDATSIIGMWTDTDGHRWEFKSDGTMGIGGEYYGASYCLDNGCIIWDGTSIGKESYYYVFDHEKNRISIRDRKTETIINTLYKIEEIFEVYDVSLSPDPVNPYGSVDELSAGIDFIYIGGWAINPKNPSSPLKIAVYVGGDAATGEFAGEYTGNFDRDDIASNSGVNKEHGISIVIETSFSGLRDIFVYAINEETGSNILLGYGKVRVEGF